MSLEAKSGDRVRRKLDNYWGLLVTSLAPDSVKDLVSRE